MGRPKDSRTAASAPDALRRPFRATGAELEFYQRAIDRWRTLPADAVLTEAARLFHFAVAIAGDENSLHPENEAFLSRN